MTDHALSPTASSSLLEPGGALEGLEIGEMVQFHGKWPFRRFWFIQEPLSVVFSLGNLWAHFKGLRALRRTRPRNDKAALFNKILKLNAVVAINSWLWSAVFHSRDLPWTEKADYFSAGGAILYGSYVAVCRTTSLGAPSASAARRKLAIVSLAAFTMHCLYLSFGRFDYGYNIMANAIVGLLQISFWLVWSLSAFFALHFKTRKDSRSRARWDHARRVLPCLMGLVLATSLELFDFEPIPKGWRLLDAHAAWHASTIPVAVLWYKFLVRDVDVLSMDKDLKEDKKRGMVWL